MSPQDSDGESYGSHYVANPRIYADIDIYGWSMYEELEADFKRVDDSSAKKKKKSL